MALGLYTTEEAAKELHTSERRIRELCSQGKLPALKCGRSWLVSLGRPTKEYHRATSGRDVRRRTKSTSG